jgi:hypothetical protein
MAWAALLGMCADDILAGHYHMLPSQMHLHCNANLSDMAVEWTALLLGKRELPGPELGLETDYPDGFVVFLSPFR